MLKITLKLRRLFADYLYRMHQRGIFKEIVYIRSCKWKCSVRDWLIPACVHLSLLKAAFLFPPHAYSALTSNLIYKTRFLYDSGQFRQFRFPISAIWKTNAAAYTFTTLIIRPIWWQDVPDVYKCSHIAEMGNLLHSANREKTTVRDKTHSQKVFERQHLSQIFHSGLEARAKMGTVVSVFPDYIFSLLECTLSFVFAATSRLPIPLKR